MADLALDGVFPQLHRLLARRPRWAEEVGGSGVGIKERGKGLRELGVFTADLIEPGLPLGRRQVDEVVERRL